MKIDEITNLGAVNIRLRSLFAATGSNEREDAHKIAGNVWNTMHSELYQGDGKDPYTILIPNMLPRSSSA